MDITKRYEGKDLATTSTKVKALIFETTNICSACRCPGCYMVASKRNQGKRVKFSLENARRVFDLVRDNNEGQEAESLDIIGGEPLEPEVWETTEALVKECLERGIKPWIFSNGIFMTEQKAKWLLERKIPVTLKLNIANFSDPKELALQAKMIGTKSAQDLIQGLLTTLRAGYANSGLLYAENLLRGGREGNMEYAGKYYRLGLEMGFQPDLELMGNGEFANYKYFKLAPSIPEIRKLMEEIQIVNQDKGIPSPQFLMPHILGSCPFYDTALYFCADGQIQPCSNNRNTLANFLEDIDPIGKALQNPIIKYRRTLTQDKMRGPCKRCQLWNKCRGGCRATAESFGNPFLSYPLCPIQTEFNNPIDILKSE